MMGKAERYFGPITRAHLRRLSKAAQAGAAVVLMSVVGASADNPMELHRMKHAAEQHLRASGIPWTIVRPTAYMETWIGVIEQTARRSGRPVVFGRGENPINVSASDVAALVRVLPEPARCGSGEFRIVPGG